MSDLMVEIVIDVHENDSDIFTDISAKNLGMVKSGESLETGDILIRHKGYIIGIELKRGGDYTNSLHSGRLHDQIYRLTQICNFPILIVEGWSPWLGEDTSEEAHRGKLASHLKTIRTLNRRICVIETEDQFDTVNEIERIVKDLKAGKLNVLRRKVVLEDYQDPQINLLSGLDNIGYNRAVDILEMFETPEKAFKKLDEWEEVKGITKRRLKKIKNIWKEEIPR